MSKWNRLDAELADVIEAERRKWKRRRPCLYCGRLTVATSQVCCACDDLPALDYQNVARDTEAGYV